MPLFRNHAVLLDQQVATDQPLLGKVWRVRPNDGDPAGDHDQAWRVFVDLHREGDGAVGAELWTSFDNVAWSRVVRVPAAQRADVVDFADLPAFGPYVQVRTTLLPPPAPPGDTPPPAPPKHRLTVRLVSDGPFTVVPG